MPTVAFHKPYGVLSRFTPDGSANRTLAGFGIPDGVWPVGRLDADSEGLLLLTSDKKLALELTHPRFGHPRTYLVQVDGLVDDKALATLAAGITIQGHHTAPADAQRVDDPGLPPRDPPIRVRQAIPTSWITLTLREGKNRQVRRMTAAVGFPTLRLLRVQVGAYTLGALPAGAWTELDAAGVASLRAGKGGRP